MADIRAHSSTSNIIRVKLRNATTGSGLTGLDHTSSGLIISTVADNESSATSYTVAGSTIETISTLGTFATPTSTKCRFRAVDGTSHPGLYEIQIADARFAVSSAKRLVVTISGATNLEQCDYEIQLTRLDAYDAVRAGLTALPNAAAEAAGGLYTRGTGTGQINQPANGMIDTNIVRISGDATAADMLEAFMEGAFLAGSVNDGSPLSTGFTIDNSFSNSTDYYSKLVLVFTSGTLKGIGRKIQSYTTASRKPNFTDRPFPANPSNGDTFVIIGYIES